MCRAVPHKVLEVAGDRARVLEIDREHWVRVAAMPDLAPGEYVVVFAGQALERIPNDEAEEFLAFNAEMEKMLEDASQ
jgi:hydrogenase expression/formation protein HypC